MHETNIDRAVKRARGYVWQGGTLQRRLLVHTLRVCPAPEQRQEVIRRQDVQAGHYGARRTALRMCLLRVFAKGPISCQKNPKKNVWLRKNDRKSLRNKTVYSTNLICTMVSRM